jgi:hypothetical protein
MTAISATVSAASVISLAAEEGLNVASERSIMFDVARAPISNSFSKLRASSSGFPRRQAGNVDIVSDIGRKAASLEGSPWK